MKNNYIDQANWSVQRDRSIRLSLKTVNLKEKLISGIAAILFSMMGLVLLLKLESGFIVCLVIAFISSLVAFNDFYKAKAYKLSKVEQGLIRKFERFLKTNNLFIREEQYITDSVVIEFKLSADRLVVRLISHGNRFTDKIAEMEAELQSALNLELIDKRQTLTSTDYFFRLRSARRINYERDCFNIVRSNRNTIAINSELEWNLTKAPHALVAGSTGGGKTYFLFHIIYSLIQKDADLYIADPKRSDLYNLRTLKVFTNDQIECEPNQICRLLRIVKEKMNERYEEMATNQSVGVTYEDCNMKPIVLVFDELAAFIASCDNKQRNEALNNLRQVIFKGRQSGVFVILATQKPEAEAIPTSIRDQVGLRVTLGNLSEDGYRMVFGKQEVEYCSCSPGEGYIFIEGKELNIPQRFKAPYIPNLERIVVKMENISNLSDCD